MKTFKEFIELQEAAEKVQVDNLTKGRKALNLADISITNFKASKTDESGTIWTKNADIEKITKVLLDAGVKIS